MGKAKTDADVNKPKRAMSSYFMFMNDRRAKFREDNPEMSMCQITKALTEVWHKLTDDEKKKYTDMANADKERYDKEMEEHNAKETPPAAKSKGTTAAAAAPAKKGKGKGKEEGAPKKPLTLYFIYLAQVRQKVKADNPNLTMCE